VSSDELFEPIQFGRYQLLERLAVGGMAEIFRAKSIGAHGFEKPVVIKRILPELAEDQDFVRMFVDEAKVMVQLQHPKIVQVLDFGQEQDCYFIAMEYVKGVDSLALLRECAHLRLRPTTGIAVHIAAEVLDALDYAHNLGSTVGRPQGVLHRDISPSNIFLSELGEVKLGDFGIAVAMTTKGSTAAKRMKGKYGYMAPELVTGDVTDRRSDIFSVGVVLAELLMIRRLFIAKSEIEVLLQVRDADLRRLSRHGSHIPMDLMNLLESALARDPDSRYQDAATFRDALHRYLFDNRLMVHSHDVSRFMERLSRGAQQPPQPTPDPARMVAPVVQFTTPQTGHQVTPVAPAEHQVTPAGQHAGEQTPTLIQAPPHSMEYASMSGERVCVLPRSAITAEEQTPQPRRKILGRKRKITLGPPPRPEPVPSHLPDTGEEPRISTADALAAMPEVEGTSTGSVHDFRAVEPEEVAMPTLDRTPAPPQEVQRVAQARISGPLPSTRPADLQGELQQRSLVSLMFRLALDEETGLLSLHADEAVKEIYLVDGDPQYVASNLPEDLFGQYLVEKGVITEGELAMALAMLPHFDGKLGSTLVGLKLLRPVQVLRHLTHQVRQKLIDAFSLERGRYVFFRGLRAEQEAAPPGLDAFGMIGVGVSAFTIETVEARLSDVMQRAVTVAISPVPPEVFRLGSGVRGIYDKLDGRHVIGELARRYDNLEQRRLFLQAVYIFLQCGLVQVA